MVVIPQTHLVISPVSMGFLVITKFSLVGMSGVNCTSPVFGIYSHYHQTLWIMEVNTLETVYYMIRDTT